MMSGAFCNNGTLMDLNVNVVSLHLAVELTGFVSSLLCIATSETVAAITEQVCVVSFLPPF